MAIDGDSRLLLRERGCDVAEASAIQELSAEIAALREEVRSLRR